MAWARAMTTSWQDVSSDRPQTTRTTPSTHTFSSIWDQAARDGREGGVPNGWLRPLQWAEQHCMALTLKDEQQTC